MKKKDVIERFCALSTKIGHELYKDSIAHDCFCGNIDDANFQFDETILEFIERAISKEIEFRQG